MDSRVPMTNWNVTSACWKTSPRRRRPIFAIFLGIVSGDRLVSKGPRANGLTGVVGFPVPDPPSPSSQLPLPGGSCNAVLTREVLGFINETGASLSGVTRVAGCDERARGTWTTDGVSFLNARE